MTGLDQGKGGKYVFVGPGQEAPTAEGAFVLRSPTYGVVLFYRTLDPDQAKGEALARRIRIDVRRFLIADKTKVPLPPPLALSRLYRLTN
jgi:hypothetical protein